MKKSDLSYANKSLDLLDRLPCKIMEFDLPSTPIDEIDERIKMIDLFLEADDLPSPKPWSSKDLFSAAMMNYLDDVGSFAMTCHMLSRCADRDSKFMADSAHVARYHDNPRFARFIENYGKTLQEIAVSVIKKNIEVNEQAKTRIPALLQKRFDIGNGGKKIEEIYRVLKCDLD